MSTAWMSATHIFIPTDQDLMAVFASENIKFKKFNSD